MITHMILRALDRKAAWLIVAIMVAAVAIPACNLLIPPGQFGHVSHGAPPARFRGVSVGVA